MARQPIKDGKLLYHLTCIDNIADILAEGLKSRSILQKEKTTDVTKFTDVADRDILKGRADFSLDKMVPFHFFPKNPFDGRVKLDHSTKKFCVITVRRIIAETEGWSIIPRHPLSSSSEFNIYPYKKGIQCVDWATMDKRDYTDEDCKSVCMAECLSPSIVTSDKFHAIYVNNDNDKKIIQKCLDENLIKNIFLETNSYIV